MAETRYIEGQDRYELAEVVGRGGFGTVWRAWTADGEDVAVKVIPVYSAGERSRAMREGQIAEDLRHENIVETLEVIPGPHEVYLVTEYVEGQPLDEAAELYDAGEIIDSLAQILGALAYAHENGVIHRDIKPQNALVDDRGVVKLTDFGVAYRPGDTRLTQVGFAVGTPGYIAPELIDSTATSERALGHLRRRRHGPYAAGPLPGRRTPAPLGVYKPCHLAQPDPPPPERRGGTLSPYRSAGPRKEQKHRQGPRTSDVRELGPGLADHQRPDRRLARLPGGRALSRRRRYGRALRRASACSDTSSPAWQPWVSWWRWRSYCGGAGWVSGSWH